MVQGRQFIGKWGKMSILFIYYLDFIFIFWAMSFKDFFGTSIQENKISWSVGTPFQSYNPNMHHVSSLFLFGTPFQSYNLNMHHVFPLFSFTYYVRV